MTGTSTPARLLRRIRPTAYELDVEVDLEGLRCATREKISFQLRRSSTRLTFHGVGLDIASVVLDEGIRPVEISVSEDDETVTFVFDQAVEVGKHELLAEFTGAIHESLSGCYRSYYTLPNGTRKSLMTTQFAEAHARTAFLCIDEPAAKTVFGVSLTYRGEGLTAISNMPGGNVVTHGDGRRTVHFAATPKMSTYLLYFSLGEWEYVEGQTETGVTVRIYVTPGKRSLVQFALETAIRDLEFSEKYFGIRYPLPVYQMVAVPDFPLGAMENWGIVAFREEALFVDESSPLASRQQVAEVICHEAKHMWFGNLVTMVWWNDVWLNEGFASWAALLALDALFPEWNVWDTRFSASTAQAQKLDALVSTHPIEVEVEDPKALGEVFDAISYAKGPSIVQMLWDWLGADAFRAGITAYLERYSYANATTADLWSVLGEVSGQPVANVMSAWTSQPGYPLLDFGDRRITQSRFYSAGRLVHEPATSLTPLWPIPLRVVVPGGREEVQMLLTERSIAQPSEFWEEPWFKPNAGQNGFYRVLYTWRMIQAMAFQLTNETLSVRDRIGVVRDLTATTEAGLSSAFDLLGLLAKMRKETNYAVWTAMIAAMDSLAEIVEDELLRRQLDDFGRWLVSPTLERLGWDPIEGESLSDVQLRPAILERAADYGDVTILGKARELFAAFSAGTVPDPDLCKAILKAIARNGAAEEFDTMLDLYRRTESLALRSVLIRALGMFRQPDLVERFLGVLLSPDDVRPQDAIYELVSAFRNREGRLTAWEWVERNWPTLESLYGSVGMMLTLLPRYLGDAFASLLMAQEVQSFFIGTGHPALVRPAAQAAEAIRVKATRAGRDVPSIDACLAEWRYHNR